MGKGFRLTWKGAEARGRVVKAVIAGLNEFHLGVETQAKGILFFPGGGVLTGTLRRSIHAAAPTYSYGADDVAPTSSSPERGGTGGMPQEQGGKVSGSIGSGLSYAMPIHNLFAYITRGYEKHEHELLPAIEKHAKLQGLT